ncbi:MAG: tRNA (adenosine(37)-N6)-threonylcarbamoyltransferase complex ATPase subunit type 1 TsaE [Thermoguttaceae bacterium]
MNQLLFHAQSEFDTFRLGAALAGRLPPGSVVALLGTLGAGKTRLVQAIAEGYGIPRRDVVSPTFVLIHEYPGDRMLYHIDAYRLKDDDEFLELGPEEYFESDGVTLVEWADRVENCLPQERLEVRIEVTGAETRAFQLLARGNRYQDALDGLASDLEAA